MRSTLTSLTVAAGAGAFLGYVISTTVDVGLATPLVAIVGVVCVLVVTAAATHRTQASLPAQLQSEHGWFWHELTRELDRSRRHKCEFVLIQVHGPQSPLERILPTGAVGLLPMPQRADGLVAFLRSSDRTWQDTDGDVYILLPETEHDDAEALLQRITQVAPHLLSSAGFAMVTFPHDGLTSGGLLSSLRERRRSAEAQRGSGAVGADAGRGAA